MLSCHSADQPGESRPSGAAAQNAVRCGGCLTTSRPHARQQQQQQAESNVTVAQAFDGRRGSSRERPLSNNSHAACVRRCRTASCSHSVKTIGAAQCQPQRAVGCRAGCCSDQHGSRPAGTPLQQPFWPIRCLASFPFVLLSCSRLASRQCGLADCVRRSVKVDLAGCGQACCRLPNSNGKCSVNDLLKRGCAPTGTSSVSGGSQDPQRRIISEFRNPVFNHAEVSNIRLRVQGNSRLELSRVHRCQQSGPDGIILCGQRSCAM